MLVKQEETLSTPVKKIFKTKNYMNFDKLSFLNNLTQLFKSLEEDGLKTECLKKKLRYMVSTYKPANKN